MTEQTEQIKYYNRLIDYDDEEPPFNCSMCNDKRKHLNSSIQVLPEHITQNIVFSWVVNFVRNSLKVVI